MASGTRRRERLLLPLGVLLAVTTACLVVFLRTRDGVRDLVERERGALAVARRLAEAERLYLEREGRYGSVAEVGAAGLLGGISVISASDANHAVSPGYRLDVLLPSGQALGPLLPLALPERSPPDPELARRHFAIVARPLNPGVSGYRSWYLDEAGLLLVSEGISDEEGLLQNPLPQFRVARPSEGKEPGPVWRSVDEALRTK